MVSLLRHQPPERSSDEASRRQLRLAKAQGREVGRAVKWMVDKVAVDGMQKRAGDYIVACAVEHAEGLYHMDNEGNLRWREPGAENAHVEIAVCDAGDGRFVPGLSIIVTVEDSRGREVGTHEQPFLWHPWVYHYGRNWELPGDGRYTFRVSIAPPSFPRHDKKNGRRYTKQVNVVFRGIKVKTGRK